MSSRQPMVAPVTFSETKRIESFSASWERISGDRIGVHSYSPGKNPVPRLGFCEGYCGFSTVTWGGARTESVRGVPM